MTQSRIKKENQLAESIAGMQLNEDSEAVDTSFEDDLNDIRDAIDKLRTRLHHEGPALHKTNPDLRSRLEAVMSVLHDVDSKIARLL